MQEDHKPNWRVEEITRNVHRVIFTGVKAGWKASALLISDDHCDNKHSLLDVIHLHHQQALDCGAPIFKFGDVNCLMQGKWDRRADQNQLRPEHRGNNYLDLVADWTSDLYAPYAKNIAVWSPGNHEGSILNHHQTDMVDKVITGIKWRTGNQIHKSAFTGFVIFGIELENQPGRMYDHKVLYFHHGYGGGGEVTRGMIDNNRTRGQAYADIFYSGHIHRRNMDENVIAVCNPSGKIEMVTQLFLRGSCYKEEYCEGNGGWHVEKGRAARPIGGWWLDFCYGGGARLTVAPRPA